MATRKTNNPYRDIVSFTSKYQPVTFISPIIPIFSERDLSPDYRDSDDEGDTSVPQAPPNPLEPKNFREFIGQEQSKEVLKIIVDSANKEKRLIPNILLTGAYGHGKTTLAKLVAIRHKKKVKIIDGTVASILVKPSTDTVYIIDEAHNIPAAVTDSFNVLIDAGELCIIGCTTNPGALPAPFRSRFRLIYLEDYQPKEISKILELACKRLSISLSKEALDSIAERSKCNPRYALTTLNFVREIWVMGKIKSEVIPLGIVQSAFDKLGIDNTGLTRMDKKYLELFTRGNNPLGLQYISSVLSIDVNTIQEEIEPYLLRMGLIERTPRGRILSGQESGPAEMPTDLLDQLKRSMESRDSGTTRV
jgi:Holliday junction DNA helicase RuvB